jgi:hypothetical protein
MDQYSLKLGGSGGISASLQATLWKDDPKRYSMMNLMIHVDATAVQR